MKIIIVSHINVISVIKNSVIPFVVSGLMIGFMLGFFITPANLGSITMAKNLIKMTLFMGVYGLSASAVLVLISFLYNLICSFTGGLELRIKEKD
ncbi:MAG: hypothetical protein K6T65_06860 [Peptococcaceae bacterium]|nr:hypothetical protein [Peptococcaceae bacterium]